MELYDLVFLGILGISCFAGVMRGGVKELVNLASFFVAVFLAVLSRPLLISVFHLDSLTGIIGAIVMFFVFYIGIRFLGNSISDSLHRQKVLNLFDRVFGLAIGIFRSLVVIGVIHLLFSLVTPIDRQPNAFKNAKVYPLAATCAKAIQSLIPKGTAFAGDADKTAKEAANSAASDI